MTTKDHPHIKHVRESMAWSTGGNMTHLAVPGTGDLRHVSLGMHVVDHMGDTRSRQREVAVCGLVGSGIRAELELGERPQSVRGLSVTGRRS